MTVTLPPAVEPAAKPKFRRARATKRFVQRSTARTVPPATIAATMAGSWICHTAHVDPLWVSLSVASVGGLGSIAAVKRNQLGYLGAATTYLASWAGLITSRGLSWEGHTDALMLAGAALLSAPWAYAHRWRHEPTEALPEPTVAEEASEFQRIYTDYVAYPGSPLAATYLTPEWEIPGGLQADIIMPRGRLATEDVHTHAKRIRSAYDGSPTEVFIEDPPDGRATRARLTVLTRDVLAQPRIWTGATLNPDTGIAIVGNFPDGAPTHLQFFAPGSGTVDTFVAGTKGSGKSRFLDKLAAEIHCTPLGVLWINDPQEGQSLSDWIDAAGNYAMGGEELGYDACLKQLRALRRIVYRRSAYHAREIEWVDHRGRERKGGKTFFDPSPELPFLYDLLDEVHILVKHPDPDIRKEALTLLSDIAKLARKTGVGLGYVVHTASQEEMGGQKAGVLRNMLREGNVVGFRTGGGTDMHMLGLKRDPSKLPAFFADGTKTQGLALIKGPDARDAPFRAEYVKDAYGIALEPARGRLDDMSLEAAAAPDDAELAPKSIGVQGLRSVVALVPSKAEKQTWAEQLLPMFADGADHTFGAIFKALPEGTSDRSVRHGLKQLVEDDGYLTTDGPRKPYRITPAGLAELARRGIAA